MPGALAFAGGALGLGAAPAYLSASFGAWTAGVGFASSAIGGSILSLAGSLLLSTAANALMGSGRSAAQADIKRELAYPTSLPAKRYVYGEARATGSPIGHPVIDDWIYGCWLLNSRPSDLTGFKIFLDGREVELDDSDKAFDFTLAGGAIATNAPFTGLAQFWIGRGDQTSPPAQILAEAPWVETTAEDRFKATDAGTGLTVIWAKLNRGENTTRQERWPSTPPLIEVEGRFSKVYDMRNPAHDPDDADTWEWSANQALCTLDALRTNPFRPYGLRNLLLPMWEAAADAADDAMALNAGGAEPRYPLSGTLVFGGSEVEDMIAPMVAAGASRLVRVGGKLGIVPGIWQEPVYTLTDLLGSRTYSDMKAGNSLPNQMQVTYTAAHLGYESASLSTWTIPGGPGGLPNIKSLDLTWITSPTQAMRVRKIEGLRAIQQRELTGTAHPSAFELIGGSVVTGDFPAPYGAVYDGLYEVASIHPGLSPQGEAGGDVAMRCPIGLVGTGPEIYAWDAATDEEAVNDYTFTGTVSGIAAPGAVTTTSGEAVAISTGSGYSPRIRFAFDPSTSGRTIFYEWQYKVGAGDWTTGGTIDANIRDGSEKVFGFVSPADLGSSYTLRVRSVAASAVSDWVEAAAITATLDIPRYTANFAAASYEIDGVATTLGGVVGVTRASVATYVSAGGLVLTAAANTPRVDYSSGTGCLLIEGSGANDWTYSEDLTNAVWIPTNAAFTANVTTAPSGAAVADKLAENTAATAQHYFRRVRSFTSGSIASFVFHVKAAGRTEIRPLFSSGGITSQSVVIDLTTGAVTAQFGTPTAVVTGLADGWWRVEMSFTPDATGSGNFYISLMSAGSLTYTGDGSSGVYLWGMQDGAGSYIATVASAGSRAADVYETRGITATLDVIATYDDTTTAAIDAAPVTPGYWPTLSQSRIRSLIGTI